MLNEHAFCLRMQIQYIKRLFMNRVIGNFCTCTLTILIKTHYFNANMKRYCKNCFVSFNSSSRGSEPTPPHRLTRDTARTLSPCPQTAHCEQRVTRTSPSTDGFLASPSSPSMVPLSSMLSRQPSPYSHVSVHFLTSLHGSDTDPLAKIKNFGDLETIYQMLGIFPPIFNVTDILLHSHGFRLSFLP